MKGKSALDSGEIGANEQMKGKSALNSSNSGAKERIKGKSALDSSNNSDTIERMRGIVQETGRVQVT
ncbi:hypothetical protein GC101_17520 [Paenibacillus sp. LMG 31459]|uniref:Spore protein n=1 Tax=Paenibacillus phytohabitans TaxID=2654978 RepID=A0ABX1YI07_9BACL|nr:hypothetical protein [Paenibacillus phytohabitans]